MQYRTLTQTEYEALRKDFFAQMEGSELTPYLDTEGVPTIGIGLNLQTSEAQTYMRNYFGFDLGDPDDLAYWGQIVIELSITQPSTAALQSSLDAIMAARALHFGAGSTTFAFADEADNLTAFNARIQSYETSTGSYYSSTGVPAYRPIPGSGWRLSH